MFEAGTHSSLLLPHGMTCHKSSEGAQSYTPTLTEALRAAPCLHNVGSMSAYLVASSLIHQQHCLSLLLLLCGCCCR